MRDSHIAYRANWNLQDAGDKVLSQSNIDAILDNYASEGSIDWDNGGHFLQEIARQIKTEYVNQVMDDEKTGKEYKDMESRLIRIEEDHR
jgi:polyhydroxyalkanoate synthesis regulator phasin